MHLPKNNSPHNPPIFTNCFNSPLKPQAIKLKKPSESFQSSSIPTEILAIKLCIKSISKSKGHMKCSSTCLKGTHMICLVRKDSNKLKKDPNPREVILEPIWAFLYRLFIRAGKQFTASEEVKSANTVKVPEIRLVFYTLAPFVTEVAKWSEKLKSKTKLKKLKWSVNNVKEADMLVNKNAQFAMVRKSY